MLTIPKTKVIENFNKIKNVKNNQQKISKQKPFNFLSEK